MAFWTVVGFRWLVGMPTACSCRTSHATMTWKKSWRAWGSGWNWRLKSGRRREYYHAGKPQALSNRSAQSRVDDIVPPKNCPNVDLFTNQTDYAGIQGVFQQGFSGREALKMFWLL